MNDSVGGLDGTSDWPPLPGFAIYPLRIELRQGPSDLRHVVLRPTLDAAAKLLSSANESEPSPACLSHLRVSAI